jgi:chromosome segregation ATPase
MNSVEDPRRADEATPLVARHGRRTEGGLRNVKYAVLTVCIGSLIAVATSRGAPSAFLGLGSQNGFPGAPVGVTTSAFDETGAPAPYISRASGAPRIGAAPKAAPPANVSDQAEAAGEIDRGALYASIKIDNAEQLDADFHAAQEKLKVLTALSHNEMETLRQQVADLSKQNDELMTENAEISQELKWHKSEAIQERERFLKVGFHLDPKNAKEEDEMNTIERLTKDLKEMYFELRKTQKKKYENYLKFQKANRLNAKLNVQVASATADYEKCTEDAITAAEASHAQHLAHIKIAENMHDEIERLEAKLRGLENTAAAESAQVKSQLERCRAAAAESAGDLKFLNNQVDGLQHRFKSCDKELNFTKAQSATVTKDLTTQLKATQAEKEALFTKGESLSERLEDQDAQMADLRKLRDDNAKTISACHVSLATSRNATEACLGEKQASDKTIQDKVYQIGNLKGRLQVTMEDVKKNTAAMEGAITKCQSEKNQCVGEFKEHAALLGDCKERKVGLETQLAQERDAHHTIAAELKKTLKTCRGSVEACEGQVEAHGDLLEDSKRRILGLEAQADTWAAKYDADTAALSVSLKESQAAKAECVGKSEQSDALIAECKKTVGQLERTVNATAAKLENTTAALEGSIKICQDEKQKCVGESKAATAIIADIRDNVDDLESKLKTAEAEFDRTSTAFTTAIETLQQEKQKCVGESAAAKELIGECAKARAGLETEVERKTFAAALYQNETKATIAQLQEEKQTCIGKNAASLELIADCKSGAEDLEGKLVKTTATLAETTAQCNADVKQLQEEKQTCVGQNAASQTVIADFKSATKDLEGKLNKTTATLAETTAQCDADVKQLQEEKQTCIGQNAASLELIADCKSGAEDLEGKLNKTTATLAETTVQCDADVKQLQEEKQTCIGQNAASLELIADCKSGAEDLEGKLNKTTATLAETTAQCDADVKQLQEEKQEAVGRAAANDEVVKDLKQNLQVIEKQMDESEDESEEQIAAMVVQLKELTAAKEECLVKNGAHKTVIDDLESNVGRCEKSLNTTRATLAESTAESAAKVKDLAAAKEECLVKNGAHKTVIDDLESNVGRCEKSLNTTRATLAESTAESAAKVRELSAAREACLVKNGAHKTVIDDLESNVDRCEKSLNTTRTTLAKTTTESAAKVQRAHRRQGAVARAQRRAQDCHRRPRVQRRPLRGLAQRHARVLGRDRGGFCREGEGAHRRQGGVPRQERRAQGDHRRPVRQRSQMRRRLECRLVGTPRDEEEHDVSAQRVARRHRVVRLREGRAGYRHR